MVGAQKCSLAITREKNLETKKTKPTHLFLPPSVIHQRGKEYTVYSDLWFKTKFSIKRELFSIWIF